MKKVKTDSYKGVRDFYPQDWMFQKWLFWQMAEVCEKFGYENYNASVLEYSELFEAKSGKEILENETYNLTDRGNRKVTMRPEMTPTISRMIAAKNVEIPRPIRWYSIPNLFRYEKPQKGRLREHYQLNVDIFGIPGIEAEIEIIQIGYQIMKNLKASEGDFKIKINNRKIINSLLLSFTEKEKEIYSLSKLIDKKEKISKKDFTEKVKEILKDKTADFINKIENASLENAEEFADKKEIEKIQNIIKKLNSFGINNVFFDLKLMRGFDYYTDTVFEFFDTHEENNRSMFGGGRYDDLLDIFGQDKIPAVGFGMGDVTAKNFMEIRNSLPELRSKTKLSILLLENKYLDQAYKLASFLRENNINTEIDLTERKIDKQIKSAEKRKIDNILIIGEEETLSQKYSLKNIKTKKELKSLEKEEILEKLK